MNKIDNSFLQAGALITVAVLAIIAAIEDNWNITGIALAGLFAIISIHPKTPGAPTDGAP